MELQHEKKLDAKYLTKRFLPYFKPYKKLLFLDLLCASLTTLCEIFFPLIIRLITDRAVTDYTTITIPFILKLGIFYLLLRVIDASANYYMQSQGHVMGAHIETDMRRDFFAHLEKLSFSFYSNTKIGQLMARLTSDLFEIAEFAHHCPEEFFISFLKIITSFIILVSINLPLTLLMFLMIPIMILLLRKFNKRMRAAFRECRHELGEINAQAEDSLLGIRVVKSFANEELEENKFDSNNKKLLGIKGRQYRAMAGFNTVTRMFEGSMYILVVTVGAYLLSKNKISTGDYMAYLLYISTLLVSIRRIVDYMEQFQRGLTGIERFVQIMDTKEDVKDKKGAHALSNVKGNVCFNNVSFRYDDDNQQDVLCNVNQTVKQGDSIAIVGPSGSGKTTLLSLLPRFYDVTKGSVTIDNCDVRDVTQKSLRDNIGIVQQEVYLFSGTVLQNIIYGDIHASREDVITASKRAGAHEFIKELPDGYDTYIGERGVKLSGGQKQRLSIARVFLKNPPILILDEATSALDNESEKLIQQSLKELQKGRTTFTIAHRLTTIKDADEIWVLTKNGIEEVGTHKELLEKEGIYSHLYSMYTLN